MGYNEIVFVGASPAHSDRVNESAALEALPANNLEENDTAESIIRSL